ncbi:MAG: hypothetical protein FD129_379 [bacterium]|nr:MAG: hypothetical protein FD129_379 [bacterium]
MTRRPPEGEFQKLAEARRTGFLAEFLGFLRQNRKWWMLPMLAVILLLGALVLLGGTPLAPFIYTLF